jgi:septum formation protein
MTLILASASPRRRELLSRLCGDFRVQPADIDESQRPGEQAEAYVRRMAREKALAIARHPAGGYPVLGADTAVVIDGAILGKPADREDARRMMRSLSGRVHEVFSAVALQLSETVVMERLNVTQVTFSTLDNAWIEACCDNGEPMDKAGAYAIQGLAAQKIPRIAGSYTCVMGLPLFETAELLHSAGLGAGFGVNAN